MVYDEGTHPRVETRLDCPTSGPYQPLLILYINPSLYDQLSRIVNALLSPPQISLPPSSPRLLPFTLSHVALKSPQLPHKRFGPSRCLPTSSPSPPRIRRLGGVPRSVSSRIRKRGPPLCQSGVTMLVVGPCPCVGMSTLSAPFYPT